MAHLEELQPWTGWGVNQDRIRPLECVAVWQTDVLSVNKHNPFRVIDSVTSRSGIISQGCACSFTNVLPWFRDKHVHNPALHDSHTLNRSQADWPDHPSWRSNSATCPDCKPSTLLVSSLLTSSSLSQWVAACQRVHSFASEQESYFLSWETWSDCCVICDSKLRKNKWRMHS